MAIVMAIAIVMQFGNRDGNRVGNRNRNRDGNRDGNRNESASGDIQFVLFRHPRQNMSPNLGIGVLKLELIKTAPALQMGRNGGMAR